MSSAVESRPSRRPRARLTKQTWTAAWAAIIFVASALALSFLPVPYVVWSPGGAHDLLGTIDVEGKPVPVIDVEGLPGYPTTGRLDLMTISQSSPDSLVSLPGALLGHWLDRRDVLPRNLIYPPGLTSSQVQAQDEQQMDTAQHDAVIAALAQAKFPIKQLPMVKVVITSGPANNLLRPGDFILTVDGRSVATPDAVLAAIRTHAVGETVSIGYLRDGSPGQADVKVVGSNQDDRTPVIGFRVEPGFSHAGRIRFNVDSGIGGPSGGLMFAIGLYDRVTKADVVAGRHVAGTGTISSKGEVGRISGIQEKIGAAERAGAEIFLVPHANCEDLAGITTSMRLVSVDTLASALQSLDKLKNPATAEGVPSCS